MQIKQLLAGTVAAIILTGCGGESDKQAGNSPAASKSEAVAQASPAAPAKPKVDPNAPTFQILPAPPALAADTHFTKIEGGSELAYLYNAHSDAPVTVPEFIESWGSGISLSNAGFLTGDEAIDSLMRKYGETSDQFKQHDIAKQIEPLYQAHLDASKQIRYVEVTLPPQAPLKGYDFATKAFPFPLSAFNDYHYMTKQERDNFIRGSISRPETRGSISWSRPNRYSLSFTNGKQFQSLVVEDESQAREIEALISSRKPMNITVFGYLESLQTGQESISDGFRTSLIKITKLVIREGDDKGKVLLSVDAKA